jgi:alkylation response protein AidB-like acyl-CoA dehydrogenase
MNVQKTLSQRTDYCPPSPDGDFYRITDILDDGERAILKRVRDFMDQQVAPIIEDYWVRDQFPFDLVPKIAALGIGGIGYKGYGSAGGSMLLNGFVSMGVGARRLVDCHILGRAYRACRRLNLPLRRRAAKAALAAGDDAFRENRLVWLNRAAGWFCNFRRNDDDLSARR